MAHLLHAAASWVLHMKDMLALPVEQVQGNRYASDDTWRSFNPLIVTHETQLIILYEINGVL